ncbi:MAG TPA: acyl-CoA thioesterase domain-containing protein [Caulobacteraceae bacterium]
MENQAFFQRGGAGYLANPVSRGPWNPQSLHGRVIVGLLAFEIEQRHGDPEFMPARLTVDMYRLPDFSPIEIATRVVRDGGRIKVIDAEFISGGVSVARATSQYLRRGEAPEGQVWARPNWEAAMPEDLPDPPARDNGMDGMWAMRPISGGIGQVGPRRTWMSEVRQLVEGTPLTPFMRAALCADFASPFAHAGDKGLGYINSDVTLYLSRLPVKEWIGLEVADHQAAAGVAVGECFLYDVDGPIGSASCAALAQRRRMQMPPTDAK